MRVGCCFHRSSATGIGSRGGSIERQVSSAAGPTATRAAQAAREANRVSSGPEWIPREEIRSGALGKRVSSGPEWFPREEIASGNLRKRVRADRNGPRGKRSRPVSSGSAFRADRSGFPREEITSGKLGKHVSSGPEWIPREEITSGKLGKRVSSGPEWFPREEVASGTLGKRVSKGPERIPREEIRSGKRGERGATAPEWFPREEIRSRKRGERGATAPEWILREEIRSGKLVKARSSGRARLPRQLELRRPLTPPERWTARLVRSRALEQGAEKVNLTARKPKTPGLEQAKSRGFSHLAVLAS